MATNKKYIYIFLQTKNNKNTGGSELAAISQRLTPRPKKSPRIFEQEELLTSDPYEEIKPHRPEKLRRLKHRLTVPIVWAQHPVFTITEAIW